MSADDFTREQDYHRERARRHNRFLHGCGVVTGLAVKTTNNAVVVQPGLGIDCAGNEVVLERETRVSLPLRGAKSLQVAIRFVEESAGPEIPTANGVEFGGIQETAVIELLPAEDAPECHAKPGTPGCGVLHAWVLATVTRRGRAWLVTGKTPRRKG